MEERYNFRLNVKSKDPNGYFYLVKILRDHLHVQYKNFNLALDKPHNIIIKNLSKEGANKKQILELLKSYLDKHTSDKKNIKYSIEEFVQETKLEPPLTNSNLKLVGELESKLRTLQETLETHKLNEDAYIQEIGRLEEIAQKQGEQLKMYEREDRRYIKEVDEKVKNLEKELQRAKLFIMRVKKGAEHYFEERKEQKLTQLDYLKKALEEGNTNKHQILDYFRKNQISITENSLTTLLSYAFKNKEIRRLKRGKYSL